MKPRGMNIGTGELLPPALVGVMVLLDRSGSMSKIKTPMEKAFDQFIADQKELSVDGMWVTLHQFDGHGYEPVYDRLPLAQVPPLSLKPRGGTPLIDSLYTFLAGARAIVDDPADPTERLLVMVVTDGEDTGGNSHRWSEVREMVQGIESTECEMNWLGTSAAVLEAQDHIPEMAVAGATVDFKHDAAGAAYVGQSMSYTAASFRGGMGAKLAAHNLSKSHDKKGAYDEMMKDVADKLKDRIHGKA